MNQFPSRVDINNGTLYSISAMPQKDSTSDGTSSFQMGRAVYMQTNAAKLQKPPQQDHQKKWMGNRDASQVTANRRNNGIGKGSINTNAKSPLSFTSFKDVNVVNDALTRCRAGGATVPPKCNNRKNGITPSFHPVVPPKNSDAIGTKYPVLYH